MPKIPVALLYLGYSMMNVSVVHDNNLVLAIDDWCKAMHHEEFKVLSICTPWHNMAGQNTFPSNHHNSRYLVSLCLGEASIYSTVFVCLSILGERRQYYQPNIHLRTLGNAHYPLRVCCHSCHSIHFCQFSCHCCSIQQCASILQLRLEGIRDLMHKEDLPMPFRVHQMTLVEKYSPCRMYSIICGSQRQKTGTFHIVNQRNHQSISLGFCPATCKGADGPGTVF